MWLLVLIVAVLWIHSLSSRISKLEKKLHNNYKQEPSTDTKEVSEEVNKEDTKQATTFERVANSDVVKKLEPKASLEETIGVQWFQWLGIGALIIALLFFLKWSFDNGFIGPVGRTLFGYTFAVGAIIAGDKLRAKYDVWALAFTGGGALAAYIVTWIGLNVYELFPAGFAMMLYILITLIICLLAGYYNAKALAVFGIIGAFATPLLTGEGGSVLELLVYIAIVNVGVLALAKVRNWQDIHVISFAFTVLWQLYALFDSSLTMSLALLFTLFFFALYLGVSCVYNIAQKKPSAAPSVSLLFLNGTIHFGLILAIIGENSSKLEAYDALISLVFAVVYLLFSMALYKANKKDTPLVLASLALTVLFSVLAVPLQFGNEWVPLAWSLEAVFLLLLSIHLKDKRIQLLAWPVMAAAYFWYLVPISSSVPMVHTAVGLGMYFFWLLLVVGLAVFALRSKEYTEYNIVPFFFVGLVVLLVAFLQNISVPMVYVGVDYAYPNVYERLVQAIALIGGSYVVLWQAVRQWHNITNAQKDAFTILGIVVQIASVLYISFEFMQLIKYLSTGEVSYIPWQITQVGISIIWALYACGTLAVGFTKSLKPLRLFGLCLLLIAIAKLTLIDLFSLGTGYRVVGFTVLGALLTGASFLYQKNRKIFQELF